MSAPIYDNSTSAKEMGTEDGFSSSMLTFAAVMTLLIMIVGILGNFLTVAALIKCPKVRNVAAAFIMSLCIADLLFCALVLPFNAFRFIEGTWRPRDFLCKMIPFIQYGNIGVSLLCIAMITINRLKENIEQKLASRKAKLDQVGLKSKFFYYYPFRYFMIAHHSTYGRIYKRHWIAAMIIFCWVFSYGMQLPTLVGAWGTFEYDPKLGTCSIMEDDHGKSSKTTLFVIAFVIPCIIIIACYTKIFWVVHKSEQRLKRHANKQNSIPNNLRTTPVATTSNVETGNGQSRVSSAESSSFSTDIKQESVQKQPTRIKDQREVRAKRNEWRITKMVLAIFLSFLICYLPITIAKVADHDVEHPNFHILSYIMLYLSACINPIIYVIMNKQYRKAYKTVIMCKPGRLLSFRKSGAGVGGGINNGNGSSVAEKWKDTGLSQMSHSRTMVSAVDHQNTSFSSSVQLPTMELNSKRNETNTKDTTEATPLPLPISGPTAAMIATENVNEPKMNNEEFKVTSVSESNTTVTPVMNDSQNTKNSQSEQLITPTNTITPRSIKRIALVGGDIILEEEEEEEEEKPKMVLEVQTDQKNRTNLPEEKQKVEMATSIPPPPPSILSQRPTPVYVNASVLQQKKNPSYGQNINVIPDNKNSKKILTKPKL